MRRAVGSYRVGVHSPAHDGSDGPRGDAGPRDGTRSVDPAPVSADREPGRVSSVLLGQSLRILRGGCGSFHAPGSLLPPGQPRSLAPTPDRLDTDREREPLAGTR